MLCTWNRCTADKLSWHRDAEKARQHRDRSRSLLRVLDHLLGAACAGSIVCFLAALSE